MYIEINKCRKIREDFIAIMQELNQNKKKLEFVGNSISKAKGFETIAKRIAEHCQEIEKDRRSIMHMLQTFDKIVDCYDSTDKSLLEKIDWHLVLDAGGMIPGAGALFDGMNTVWYMAEGKGKEAFLSGLAFVPIAGEIVGAGKTGGKAGMRMAEHADEIGHIVKGADKAEDGIKGAKNILDDVAESTLKSGSYSGGLVKVDSPDAAADALAVKIGGESRVKFADDPNGREFDVVSSEYIAQAKPDLSTYGKNWRKQTKATFEAAQETGRKAYFQFEGQPDASIIRKIAEYGERYGVEYVIDTTPLGVKN